ncbi:hypothetical protein YC2023_100747 [Brassica napus]
MDQIKLENGKIPVTQLTKVIAEQQPRPDQIYLLGNSSGDFTIEENETHVVVRIAFPSDPRKRPKNPNTSSARRKADEEEKNSTFPKTYEAYSDESSYISYLHNCANRGTPTNSANPIDLAAPEPATEECLSFQSSSVGPLLRLLLVPTSTALFRDLSIKKFQLKKSKANYCINR